MGLFGKYDSFWQFVKFGIVGVTNTVISYLIYLLFLFTFQWLGWIPDFDYIAAHFIGYVLSIFWAFYWNRRYVFEKPENDCWYKELAKSFLSYSFTGIVLSTALLYLWVDIIGISKVVAPVINLCITVPLNFLLNRYWAFK